MKMDAESNYESDISESWSLIDINLNDEPLITTKPLPTVEKSHSSDSVRNNINETEFQIFERKHEKLHKSQFNETSDSESDSDSSFKNEACRKAKNAQSFQDLEDVKNDSGDAESIEILDMDGNYQDSEVEKLDASVFDNFNLCTYQSDSEESSDGKVCNESRSNSSTVIKRKRRKISRDSKDILYCENGCGSNKKELSDTLNKTDNHPVYKHYKNNVANTVLNLSVGVIFAGVACMAIGHFLGVQDAAETAVELVETLKKLQVENAALQSSMGHLKKALLTLEANSKLEMTLSQPHNKIMCEETPKISSSSSRTDLNSAVLSEVCSSLNSIDWISQLQNTAKKGTETGNTVVDMKGLKKHIHDQLNLFYEKKKEGAKLSENTDFLIVLKKLLILLKKIMNKLSSSHDNIEIMQERLIELKSTINHNLNKIFRNSSIGTARENRVPVTEDDLRTIQWSSNNKMQLGSEDRPKSSLLYKFPQPQKYYDLEVKGSKKNFKNNDYEKDRKNKNNPKRGHDEAKRKKKERKEIKSRDKNKKEKSYLAENHGKKVSVYVKNANNLRPLNKFDFSYKKKLEKNSKFKRRAKKIKNSKLKKVLSSNLQQKSDLNKKYVSFCSESQCFNLTGYWIFKWANGREAFRRHQNLGDWQFERSRARKNVRDIEQNNNWQFERAKARKELRNEDFSENWQFKRALARESNRNDERAQFTKYGGKEFFQERFSWI